MIALSRLIAAATPSPSPSAFNPDDVTPGWIGFAVFFVIALLTVLLILDFVRRVRRVRYRDEIKAKLDREEAERARSSRAKDVSSGDGPSHSSQ